MAATLNRDRTLDRKICPRIRSKLSDDSTILSKTLRTSQSSSRLIPTCVSSEEIRNNNSKQHHPDQVTLGRGIFYRETPLWFEQEKRKDQSCGDSAKHARYVAESAGN
jgi:hypothetical protein